MNCCCIRRNGQPAPLPEQQGVIWGCVKCGRDIPKRLIDRIKEGLLDRPARRG